MKTIKAFIKANANKGQFISVLQVQGTDACDKKLRKNSALRGRVTREVYYTACRVCDYENMSQVKEKRAEGIEATKPTWWTWVEFPYFAQHITKGTEYFVVKPTTEKPKVQYYLDGKPINKKDFPNDFLKSQDKESLVYMITLSEVVAINQQQVRKEYAPVA